MNTALKLVSTPCSKGGPRAVRQHQSVSGPAEICCRCCIAYRLSTTSTARLARAAFAANWKDHFPFRSRVCARPRRDPFSEATAVTKKENASTSSANSLKNSTAQLGGYSVTSGGTPGPDVRHPDNQQGRHCHPRKARASWHSRVVAIIDSKLRSDVVDIPDPEAMN